MKFRSARLRANVELCYLYRPKSVKRRFGSAATRMCDGDHGSDRENSTAETPSSPGMLFLFVGGFELADFGHRGRRGIFAALVLRATLGFGTVVVLRHSFSSDFYVNSIVTGR